MGKSNKFARVTLEKQYGKGCMFKRADIEKQIEELRIIKTYKRFIGEKHYSGKIISKLEKEITFHHLIHKSEGGQAISQNGANVSALAHEYIHSLPREQEEIINNMLRKWKINYVLLHGNGVVEEANSIEIDETQFIEIPVYEQNTKYHDPRQERARLKNKMNDYYQEYVDR